MKQVITLLAVFLLLSSHEVYAQSSFSVESDTVDASPPIGVSTTVEDGISAATGTVTVSWKVIASNFPSDWIPAYSICDNNTCYLGAGLWTPSGGTLSTHISAPYGTATTHTPGGDFHVLMDFADTSSNGCYYMTVRINNQAIPADTAYETYIICNSPAGIAPIPKPSGDDIVLYPNPTRDELNVVYNASADIKNIAVYNIIGKILAVYKVTNNNGANLNLENIPSGIYFVRLINAHGDVVVTRKFTKQ